MREREREREREKDADMYYYLLKGWMLLVLKGRNF
jgi:hypothetical protein